MIDVRAKTYWVSEAFATQKEPYLISLVSLFRRLFALAYLPQLIRWLKRLPVRKEGAK